MAAYIIAHLDVTDPEGFQAYRAAVSPVVETFGGRYLVRGGGIEVLEGDWTVPRLVVIAFDSAAQAKAFYHSDAYQEVLPLRTKASRGTLVVAEGI
jgi:uncharacterized protein (DUF1330 family)